MNLPVDFPDRLSPMLVKELRQGMRTNLFTISFILLQAFMVLSLLFAAASDAGGGGVAASFWVFLCIALLGVQPVRGFAALHSENHLNTMDLIQMTRLSAWRITFGKWLALVSQSLLLAVAVIPYIVMRYFLGGVNFVAELYALAMVGIVSMVLTAITVGFSAFPSILLRAAIAIGLLFTLFMGSSVGVNLLFLGFPGGPSLSTFLGGSAFWWSTLIFVVTSAYVSYFFLDLGASRIAPESANHSTRKRLIALAFVVFCLGLSLFIDALPEEMLLVYALIVLIASWIDAITEKAAMVPSILRPFARRPPLMPAMFVLTPGWHTALFYIVISAAITLGLIVLNTELGAFGGSTSDLLLDIDVQIGLIATAGVIVFPLLVISLVLYPVTFSRFFFGLYVLIQACLWLLTGMVALTVESNSGVGELLYYCLPLPSVILVANASPGGVSDAFLLIAATVSLILSLLVPFLRALPLYRKMFATSREIALEPRGAEGGGGAGEPTPLQS